MLEEFQRGDPLSTLDPVADPEQIIRMQQLREEIKVSAPVREYIAETGAELLKNLKKPKEYGIRLAHLSPQIEKEIRLIVNLHDEAVCGGISPDNHQLCRARLAFRRIRNPLLWFARLKFLCFHNRL